MLKARWCLLLVFLSTGCFVDKVDDSSGEMIRSGSFQYVNTLVSYSGYADSGNSKFFLDSTIIDPSAFETVIKVKGDTLFVFKNSAGGCLEQPLASGWMEIKGDTIIGWELFAVFNRQDATIHIKAGTALNYWRRPPTDSTNTVYDPAIGMVKEVHRDSMAGMIFLQFRNSDAKYKQLETICK